jgi:putative MFS transporter
MTHEVARRPVVFWSGTLAIIAGVCLHLPFFFTASVKICRAAGLPMDGIWDAGMAIIIAGTCLAAYGVLPARAGSAASALPSLPRLAGSDAILPAHWALMATLAIALIIDTMKPASIGFVLPGIRAEYHLTKSMAALLPVSALTGTLTGSYLFGILADAAGRRAAILLAGLMFIGSSICGAMPSFAGNVVMCFIMGQSAGGMLPIAFTLLSESMPAKHRGWALVLLGGVGAVGGYLAASVCASILEPRFGWRVMWLLGLPTGILLIALNRFMPESPKFLLLHGHPHEALRILARFGLPFDGSGRAAPVGTNTLFRGRDGVVTFTLNALALAWGLVNFGVILWLPAELRASGYDVGGSDTLLAESSLMALPTTLLAAWLYARWDAQRLMISLCLLTALGLIGVASIGHVPHIPPIVFLTVLMIGSNGVIAVLLPMGAEHYATVIRGRGTGLVAACSTLGGVAAQLVSMAALVPQLSVAAVAMAAPMVVSALLFRYCLANPAPDRRH